MQDIDFKMLQKLPETLHSESESDSIYEESD